MIFYRIKNRNIGSTIMEALVSILLVSLLLIIFGVSYTAILEKKHINNKSLATNLVVEELESLRLIPLTSLTNRTDSPFINILNNESAWFVDNDSAAGLNGPGGILSTKQSTWQQLK